MEGRTHAHQQACGARSTLDIPNSPPRHSLFFVDPRREEEAWRGGLPQEDAGDLCASSSSSAAASSQGSTVEPASACAPFVTLRCSAEELPVTLEKAPTSRTTEAQPRAGEEARVAAFASSVTMSPMSIASSACTSASGGESDGETGGRCGLRGREKQAARGSESEGAAAVRLGCEGKSEADALAPSGSEVYEHPFLPSPRFTPSVHAWASPLVPPSSVPSSSADSWFFPPLPSLVDDDAAHEGAGGGDGAGSPAPGLRAPRRRAAVPFAFETSPLHTAARLASSSSWLAGESSGSLPPVVETSLEGLHTALRQSPSSASSIAEPEPVAHAPAEASSSRSAARGRDSAGRRRTGGAASRPRRLFGAQLWGERRGLPLVAPGRQQRRREGLARGGGQSAQSNLQRGQRRRRPGSLRSSLSGSRAVHASSADSTDDLERGRILRSRIGSDEAFLWRSRRSTQSLSYASAPLSVREPVLSLEEGSASPESGRSGATCLGCQASQCKPNRLCPLYVLLCLSLVCFPLVLFARVVVPETAVPDYAAAIIPFFCLHFDLALSNPGLSQLRLPFMTLHLAPLIVMVGIAVHMSWICHLACLPFYAVLLFRWPRTFCVSFIVGQLHLELVLASANICRIPYTGSQGWVACVLVAFGVFVLPWVFFLTTNSQMPACSPSSRRRESRCFRHGASLLLLVTCVLWCLMNTLLVSNLFSFFFTLTRAAAAARRALEASSAPVSAGATDPAADASKAAPSAPKENFEDELPLFPPFNSLPLFSGLSRSDLFLSLACLIASAMGVCVLLFLRFFKESLLPRAGLGARSTSPSASALGANRRRGRGVGESEEDSEEEDGGRLGRMESGTLVPRQRGSRAANRVRSDVRPNYRRHNSTRSLDSRRSDRQTRVALVHGTHMQFAIVDAGPWRPSTRRTTRGSEEITQRQRAERAEAIQRKLITRQYTSPVMQTSTGVATSPRPSSVASGSAACVEGPAPGGADVASPGAPAAPRSSFASVLCTICQDTLDEGAWVSEVPVCGHMFHAACLRSWLVHGVTCPNCNTDLDTALLAKA
ncbi:hypothetical protein BESB_006590 [Besnoitia besnoiti]|uniref:RING-type domain-containing protein n=1 Tax=Besnoitia besnoiti TaxID=94643 RepID=A0A2A9MIF4_BESBE|nr:hypothetical protein BESB_006590 [Besnoitia besnoiti]PFH38318.1 hypothetical protein BESB_006590 [Besnoitia besnoiti]